ncbi:MAG: GNAT family N-acetyltransferase [Opitutales bacterium]|nr:GNAT family N-acetyltransferase [Opitutales bacterium]
MSTEVETLQCCPILYSERLALCPIQKEDAERITELLSDYETVYMMTYAPWPYTLADSQQWIDYVHWLCSENKGRFWGIYDSDGVFIGTIGMSLYPEHDRGELHYWLGRLYWGKGYGTEAAKRAIRYAFQDLRLECLDVNHMSRNLRSQRLIQKCGFQYEGTFRHYVKRFGHYEDVKNYSLLRSDLV